MHDDASTERSRLRLLLLEDDPFMRGALERALADHDVDVVERVATSKEHIAKNAYAAWLLDITVPDGSGLDVLAWARAEGHRTPALVMTGHADHAEINRAQRLGAEFLYKPYSRANLEAFLERVSAERAPSRIVVNAAIAFARQHDLTPRETDVLTALARGVARADLPAALGVTENTLKTIVRRLLDRCQRDSLDAVLRDLLKQT
jgi:DNA-binding NarL/FixJ family response regulator